MEQGKQHSERAEWKDAQQAFNKALNLWESVPDFPNATRYKQQVLDLLEIVRSKS